MANLTPLRLTQLFKNYSTSTSSTRSRGLFPSELELPEPLPSEPSPFPTGESMPRSSIPLPGTTPFSFLPPAHSVPPVPEHRHPHRTACHSRSGHAVQHRRGPVHTQSEHASPGRQHPLACQQFWPSYPRATQLFHEPGHWKNWPSGHLILFFFPELIQFFSNVQNSYKFEYKLKICKLNSVG
jgi:hypothetical protein